MKKTIYIFSEGELKRKDNTLFFETNEGKRYLPIEDINEIMIFGEVTFNKKLLELMSQKEVLIHYFNYYGYYMGTFYPREHLNAGYMILKQAEHYQDADKRLTLAKSFSMGAYRNIRQVLKYYNNRGKDLENFIDTIERLALDVPDCKSVNSLMAVEGHIRETYYKSFDEIIQNKDFKFKERTRRPPKNELNVLISLGNSILYTQILSEIYKTHLDPRIGFLHATNFRRFSLNLDIAEIFKPIIIDRLIFSVIDKGMITKNDFQQEFGGLLLKDRAKKVFVEQLDKRLQSTIKHRELSRNVSYRRLIRLELYKLEKHLIGEKAYQPFVARW
ncbi:MAG TPA: type I-B CRISPR-associated endonuclease Cas1 [Clostridiales bacterium]|nr:type I-B CRISPR-associated endonuclease Cas1 [Clostridiales bacterium]